MNGWDDEAKDAEGYTDTLGMGAVADAGRAVKAVAEHVDGIVFGEGFQRFLVVKGGVGYRKAASDVPHNLIDNIAFLLIKILSI